MDRIEPEVIDLITDVANKFRDAKGQTHISRCDVETTMQSAEVVSVWIRGNNEPRTNTKTKTEDCGQCGARWNPYETY